MSSMRVAINGFGRIGRMFFRQAFGLPEFDIIAINDLGDINNLAYLLQYDSVYRTYNQHVEVAGNALRVGDKEIAILQTKDPAQLPWKDLEIDLVVEATGIFTSSQTAGAHLEAGAARVVISAPAKGEVTTALCGVNDDRFAKAAPITSNASCTTNATAPVLAILHETCGIVNSSMITVHGYTSSQQLVDGPDAKDMRRGRAAAVNIIPSTTSAARAVGEIIPELQEKFDAAAVRVPTVAGSLSIITAQIEQTKTIEEINMLLKAAAEDLRWSATVKTTEDKIVSSDIIGEPYGALIDLSLTRVSGGTLVQVYSWYDNEWGYAATLVEHIRRVIKSIS